MATSEGSGPRTHALLTRLRAAAESRSDAAPVDPSDLSRASIEAMQRSTAGSARQLTSRGRLRFSGTAIHAHSADLDDIGLLSSAWQRAVTATGAALENLKAVQGKLPADVIARTRLVLTASPLPGSIVFLVEPKSPALAEVEPDGQPPLSESLEDRPLADRASEALVELLATAAEGDPQAMDAVAGQLLDLGPRVGSALGNLVRVIQASDMTLDATWQEPSSRTRRASVTPTHARFIGQVVEGRGLDAVTETLTGTLRTISDSQRWLLDLGEQAVRLDISELNASELTRWNLHQIVDVDTRISLQERADGRVVRHYAALAVREASGPLSLFVESEE